MNNSILCRLHTVAVAVQLQPQAGAVFDSTAADAAAAAFFCVCVWAWCRVQSSVYFNALSENNYLPCKRSNCINQACVHSFCAMTMLMIFSDGRKTDCNRPMYNQIYIYIYLFSEPENSVQLLEQPADKSLLVRK